MEDFKRYFPDYGHKRVHGAVAYLRSESEAATYAERQGLFVVRATGGQREHRQCGVVRAQGVPVAGSGRLKPAGV